MEETVRYSLCPNCDACPEVIVGAGEVTIGEDDNVARLSKAEWNVLVDAILHGDLARLEGDDA